MSDEQLQQLKNDLVSATTKTVEVVVNGKINQLQTSFNDHRELSQEHWEKMGNHIQQMEPVIEALNFFNTGRKFALWLKPLVPAIIFIGVMWVAFKRLFQ